MPKRTCIRLLMSQQLYGWDMGDRKCVEIKLLTLRIFPWYVKRGHLLSFLKQHVKSNISNSFSSSCSYFLFVIKYYVTIYGAAVKTTSGNVCKLKQEAVEGWHSLTIKNKASCMASRKMYTLDFFKEKKWYASGSNDCDNLRRWIEGC